MTDNDEDREKALPGAPDSPAEPPPEPPQVETEPPPSRAPRRGSVVSLALSLVAVLLACAALGGGYWAWQQLSRKHVNTSHEVAGLTNEIGALRAQIGAQASQQAVDALNKQVSALEQQMKTQAQTLATLNRAIEQGRALAQRNRRGWRLAEVKYLMRIARYRLDLMHDFPGSIAALKAADQQLAAIADPNLLPVREALAKEIGQLQNFKKPDRVGIMLQLAQLGDHLHGLPPVQPALGGSAVKPSASHAAQGGWRGLLESVWQVISKHITIRHYNQPVEGAAGPEAQLYMNQVLRLRLEAARVAVMRSNNAEFHSELKAALAWLDAHYAAHAAAPIRQQLQALLKRDIAPTPPNIGGSLTLLRRLTNGPTQTGGTS